MKLSRVLLFLVLFLLCMAGAVLVIPYAFTTIGLTDQNLPLPLSNLVTMYLLQSAFLFGAAVVLGMGVGRRVGLGAPFLERLTGNPVAVLFAGVFVRGDGTARRVSRVLLATVLIAIVAGIAASLAVTVIDLSFFRISVEASLRSESTVPVWQRVLAALYGGVNEEVLMRFFVLSVLAFLFLRAERASSPAALSPFGMWAAIVLTAALFGIGHLPFAAEVGSLEARVALRAILLNVITGVVFGWVYRRRGLEAAMIAHFTSDVCLLVLLPSLLGRLMPAA